MPDRGSSQEPAGSASGDEPAVGGEPVVRLERWDGVWPVDDPFAGLKTDVAAYSNLDALSTLRGLSETSGVPVGALARYVLARWASGGNDAVLELGVSGVDHLVRIIEDAEAVGTDEARLEAYTAIASVVSWLRAGVEQPSPDGPGDGSVSGAGDEDR
jgi:hypothetical protein